MRSLVTGGGGFIGSHVARRCLNLGHEVVVLDDLSGGFESNVPADATFIRGSVTDVELVNALFLRYRFTYVYHLAAYAAEGLSHFIRGYNYTTNLIGSVNLINAAINFRTDCFVFTSSIAVYGKAPVPMLEAQVPLPIDPYGIGKYAIELDLRSAHDLFGLDFIVFRPHNVYGEHQNIGDRYRNVIGIFMNQALSNEPMTIFGDGTQTRAFSYVDNVSSTIARSVQIPEARNQVFNLGADTPHTVLRVADMVARAFRIEPRFTFLPARNEVVNAYAQHDKVRRVFGNSVEVPLEDGIERMARWAQAHGARVTPPFANIEVRKNIPPVWLQASDKSRA
ncbi:MAG: NAD-dependent epimerase/dehydratase family protein [Candidatus Binataceae bacterium]